MAWTGTVKQLARHERLVEERDKIDEHQRTLNELIELRDGKYTPEEQKKWDGLDTRYNELTKEINDLSRFEDNRSVRDLDSYGPPEDRGSNKMEYNEESRLWLAQFANRLGVATPEQVEELRSLSASIDTEGGFAIPSYLAQEFISEREKYTFVRRFARKFMVEKADSFRAPVMEHGSAAQWQNELATGTSDDTLSFEARELHPHPLTKKIIISKKLIRTSPLPIQEYITNHMAYKMAIAEEEAFLQGSGASQPLGIFTANDSGVTSSRWVSTGNTSTQIKSDNLFRCVENLRPEYQTGARWVFSLEALRRIRTLKDGEGRYLFEPDLQRGTPGFLLGFPIDVSQFCPSTFSASQAVGALVNWDVYWIVDSIKGVEVQVLDQLYAESYQDMILCRSEVDGACVDELGAVIVSLAA